MASKKPTPPSAVYTLKVSLRGVKPALWRRVLVGDTIPLLRLHRVFQALMGWGDKHLHQFSIGGELFGEASVEGFSRIKDEKRFTLGELLPAAPAKFVYTYDFSVNWEFEVLVEEIAPPAEGQVLPQCIKGKRAAPPEHIGGAWGYMALLEARENPRHPERTRFAELIATYDPEAVDLEAINLRLKKVK
jgi:hypothetical protein